ncbi:rod shape-determining protein MreC [Compostibacter hankyongensis]|uniref:rod shape-determining protein MreC n=1 Tax=Compostibacter hankyongensis TaxID=1007089 RepID=UPI0031EE318A
MRNLIIFIRRYFNFFLFLVIEIFCLVLVFRNNNYQRATVLNSANRVTAGLYKKYNAIQYYFHLKAINDSLAVENDRLRNQLLRDFRTADTLADQVKEISDTAGRRKYLYMPARVVNNSVNTLVNYITIERGSEEGVTPNMAVISATGVAGIVRSVSDHYAVAISLLNKDSRISARLTRTGNFGSVRWNGRNPRYGTLTDIPRNVKVYKNDSVVTSGYSTIFPEGLLIGYVEGFTEQKSSNFHTIRIRFATDFYRLQYVSVIRNLMSEEQKKLEASVPHE